MISKIAIFGVISVGILLSGCQDSSTLIQNNTEETIAPSYTTQHISATISCDEYTIQSIKDLGYTGNVTPQGTGCVISGTQYNYNISSLGVRIIFDNIFSPYFLDQSQIPEITLQDNIIIYNKDHSLMVVKNYTGTLADYITHNFSQCDYDISDPVASNEYQIKCETPISLHFYNISLVNNTLYVLQYVMGGQGFRFEIL